MLEKGSRFTDGRGTVSFVNSFDMTPVVRMYCIEPETGIIRAWQGHQKETKWFHLVSGSIRVKIRDLQSKVLVGTYELNAATPAVLKIAPGHYNGFEALEENSMLLVFSDLTLEQSQKDDHRLTLEDLPW